MQRVNGGMIDDQNVLWGSSLSKYCSYNCCSTNCNSDSASLVSVWGLFRSESPSSVWKRWESTHVGMPSEGLSHRYHLTPSENHLKSVKDLGVFEPFVVRCD